MPRIPSPPHPPPPPPATPKMPSLSAVYSSPAHGTAVFSRDLPPVSAAPATDEKTAFLSALRQSVSELQSEVNAHVTQNMEQEKKDAGIDESKEAALEANYGEEVVEEDE
ncbi:ekc keops complex subunit gon7 protein [Diplodia corticola]|uniref:EKC/KEOPS complex subunit GON7 n=1 Tax=Diplodia corticola TaxID=236234 RepID=A0A1J9R360_9PEZI|nr:ekc keops complex subunit gon7 protein [Diplodia corticola]OJD35862.1 ekc keops complex subunit gon7 protein [Diplodia corticola]